jgi:Tfp pilus assembly protein PilF
MWTADERAEDRIMTANSNPLEQALAHLEAGDWDGAHKIVQDDPSPEAAWVHAHLHRIEGDLSNARYWYRRAGRPESTAGLEDEAREIAQALKTMRNRAT